MRRDENAVVAERIDDWRRRLIDLSYRNRLIKYRPTRASTIEIESPDLAILLADLGRTAPWRFYFPPEPEDVGEPVEQDAATFVDEVVVHEAQHPERPPQPDEIVVRREVSPRRINRMLENLARKSNAEFQDKALRILYIAAGILDWVDEARGEALASPLILVPVELRRVTARHPYVLHFVDDEDVVINPSLTEKLRRDLRLELPAEWAWEDQPVETELDEIEAAVSKFGWTVRREAVLGLFSFQKFVMYRDLLDNESIIAQHPIIRSLAGKRLADALLEPQASLPAPANLDEVQPPATDFSILDADSTQRLCIEAAKRGESFVMQGPPGTGKSQTIANVIGDAIARGKRVLFVSEKAAALDVVHKRLAAQGLDEFCLLLHGEHAARREVVESLNHSLTGETIARIGMSSHEFERLAHLREVLNSTAQLVHLPMPRLGDRTLWDVLGELAHLHGAPSVPAAPEASDAEGAAVRREHQQLDEIFQRLQERWNVSPRDFVWRDYAGDRFSADERGRVFQITGDQFRATESLAAVVADVARLLGWPVPINLRAAEQLLDLGDHLDAAPLVADHWLAPGAVVRVTDAADAARVTFDALERTRESLRSFYPSRTIDDFRESIDVEVHRALKALDDVAGRTAAWESELLPNLPKIRRFLTGAPELISRISATAAEAAKILGQRGDSVDIGRARQLSRLAAFAFRTEDRPERDWLVRPGLERARSALDETRASFEHFQDSRGSLLERYEPGVLELDGAELLRRFTSEYRSRLARLRSAYRIDAKTIKAVRRDRRLPAEIADDLRELVDLQERQHEIARASERLGRAFGSYFRGVDTDVTAIERACAAADQVIQLAAPHSDLAALGDQVAAGSSPDARIAQIADRLSADLSQLVEGLDAARPFVGRASQLFDDASLDVLDERLRSLDEAYVAVDDIVGDIVGGSPSPVATLAGVSERARLVTEARELASRIVRDEPTWAHALDRYYRAGESDWGAIADAMNWLAAFADLTRGGVPPQLRALLLDESRRWPDFPGLRAARDAYAEASEALVRLFDDSRGRQVLDTLQQSDFVTVLEFSRDLEQHVDDLHDWIEFRSWCDRARDRGWGDFVSALIEAGVATFEVVSAFRRAFWNRRLEAVFAEDPDLQDRGSTYERWIREFRELDKRLVRTAADRVIAARGRLRSAHVAVPGSQVALLRNEAAKKRRHMPVRKLLAAIPGLLSELKPCLMMSPLTISHFLAPNHEFDMVIFDEASQVPPQDAINCIYRGRQLIVAGDSRQLPPTPFFHVAEAEEAWSDDVEDTAEDMESLLDSCEALLPRHPLRWHYRSRHEHLISFSNEHVYDRRLLTFPSADAFSAAKGVRFIHVPDGVYDRGRTSTNRREAQVVAERVVAHLQAGRRSVGVITFNVAQANIIAEELDRARIEHAELEDRFAGDRLDAVFVKHLESVQGDERDVIVFSIGYGRDSNGKFTMNFGPLNKEGGYRRLNVAVTRARELVEVVSSVHSSDFTLPDSASRGAHLLREYVRYAEAAAAGPPADFAASEFSSPIEVAIAEAVSELGYEPIPQVGAGAFGVEIGVRHPEDPDSYLLGVETDGQSYSAAPTARDRDRLRDEILANLGWRTHRIWAIDWTSNRQSEIERLERALAEALDNGAALEENDDVESLLPPRERADRLVEELRDAIDAVRLPWVVEYERLELPRQQTLYEFHETINRDAQRDLVIKLVSVEAPVHVDYIIRRLARAWGLQRTGGRIQKAGREAIRMAVRSGVAEIRGDFLWRPGQILEAVRSPNWDDERTFRSIHEIPPEEIDLAFGKLLDASGAFPGPELISQAAKILGFDRVGGQIRDVLSARLAAYLPNRQG